MSSIGELDLARSFPGIARTRVNLFRQQGCVSAAIRLLADHIPSLEELSLPPVVADFAAGRFGADGNGQLCFQEADGWRAVRTVEYSVDRTEPVLP